ncbi:titin homolog isoform X2 [Dermacentor silvarum]|uniref:titin homolog isoform X2 n=1 Tax=Dermacentor silvarum TaxID=543639 RepID=UPI0021012CAF|nr:titin homolog isoform X2 [Dermacentor silvarum]
MTTEQPEVAPPPEVEEARAFEAVRPTGVLYVEPPSYELEYLHVPEFMTREQPTGVPVQEKEAPVPEALMPVKKLAMPPPAYEVQFPYVTGVATIKPEAEVPKKEKGPPVKVPLIEAPEYVQAQPPTYDSEYTYVPEFMTTEQPEVAPPPEVEEARAFEAVRPTGVLYVEPPSYELEYLHVPEFMTREQPTGVPVQEKEAPVPEAAMQVKKLAMPPPAYEVQFPYVTGVATIKPEAEVPKKEKGPPVKVPLIEAPEYVQAQPPTYESEYTYVPEFMTTEQPEVAPPPEVEEARAFEAVRPTGVLYVEPPSYELEYLHVPEFMTREQPTGVPVQEKEAPVPEAAMQVRELAMPPPAYEVQFPYVAGFVMKPTVEVTKTQIREIPSYSVGVDLAKKTSTIEYSGTDSTSFREASMPGPVYSDTALGQQVSSSSETTHVFESAESTFMEAQKQKYAAVDVPGDARSCKSTSSLGASRVEEGETAMPSADQQASAQATISTSGFQIPVTVETKTDGRSSLQEDVANGLFHYSRFADTFGKTEALCDADLEKIKQEFGRLPFPPEQQLPGAAGKVRRSSSSSDFSSFSTHADAITRRMVRDVTTVERFQKLLPSMNEKGQPEEAPSQTSSDGQKKATAHRGNFDVLTTEKVTHMEQKLEYIEPILFEDFSTGTSRRNSDDEKSKSAEFITTTIVLKSEKEEEMQYADRVPLICSKGGEPSNSAAGPKESRSLEASKCPPEKDEERFIITNVKKETRVKEKFQVVKPMKPGKKRKTTDADPQSKKLVKSSLRNEVTLKQFLHEAEHRRLEVVEAEMIASLRPEPSVAEEETVKFIPVEAEQRQLQPSSQTQMRTPRSRPLERDFADELPSVDELELSLHPPMGIGSPPRKIDASTVMHAVDMADGIPDAEETEVVKTHYSLCAKSLAPRPTNIVEMSVLHSVSDAPSVEEADFPISPQLSREEALRSRTDSVPTCRRQSERPKPLSNAATEARKKPAPEDVYLSLPVMSHKFESQGPMAPSVQATPKESSASPSALSTVPQLAVRETELAEHQCRQGLEQESLKQLEQENVHEEKVHSDSLSKETFPDDRRPSVKHGYKEITASEDSQPPEEPQIPELPIIIRPSSPTYRLLEEETATPETTQLISTLEPEPVHYPQLASPDAHHTYKIIDVMTVEEPVEQQEEVVLEPVSARHDSTRYQMYNREGSVQEPLTAIEQEVVAEAAPKSDTASLDADESLLLEQFDKDSTVSEDNQPQELHIPEAPLTLRPSSPTYHLIEDAATPDSAATEPNLQTEPPLPPRIASQEGHHTYKIIDIPAEEEPQDQHEEFVPGSSTYPEIRKTSKAHAYKTFEKDTESEEKDHDDASLLPEVELSSPDMKHKTFKLLGQAKSAASKPPPNAPQAHELQYELEYLYVPDFMKQETASKALTSDSSGKLSPKFTLERVYTPDYMTTAAPTVRPLAPVTPATYEQPREYALEYMYVPDFMRSEAPALTT